MEFSKKLLVLDYGIFLLIILFSVIFQNVDLSSVAVAWIVQIGISSSAYYWKSKHENKLKIPFKIIRSLPIGLMEKIDLTQILSEMIRSSD